MPMADNIMNKPVDPPQLGQELVKVELRDYQSGDEKDIIQVLSTCHNKDWGNEEFWRWKHVRRPGFTKPDVVIAATDTETAACFHGAVLPLVLDTGLEIPMNVEGDFAVLPENRKLGIPDQAHDLISRRLLERGVMLRGGFTSRELNERFYHKRFGYIFIPAVSTEFRKIIGLKPLQQRVAKLSERLLANERIRQALRNVQLSIDLTIDNFPPCHLEISEHQIALLPGFASSAQLKVRLSYSMLVAAISGPMTLLKTVLSDGIRGRFHVKGLMAHMGLVLKVVIRLVPM